MPAGDSAECEQANPKSSAFGFRRRLSAPFRWLFGDAVLQRQDRDFHGVVASTAASTADPRATDRIYDTSSPLRPASSTRPKRRPSPLGNKELCLPARIPKSEWNLPKAKPGKTERDVLKREGWIFPCHICQFPCSKAAGRRKSDGRATYICGYCVDELKREQVTREMDDEAEGSKKSVEGCVRMQRVDSI